MAQEYESDTAAARLAAYFFSEQAYDECPLSGVKQTSESCAVMFAFDPKRTFAASICCDAQHSRCPQSREKPKPVEHAWPGFGICRPQPAD